MALMLVEREHKPIVPWLTKTRSQVLGAFLLGLAGGLCLGNGYVTSSVVQAKNAQIVQKEIQLNKAVTALGCLQKSVKIAQTALATAYADPPPLPNCPTVTSIAKE